METFWRCCFNFFCEKGRKKTKKRIPLICWQTLNLTLWLLLIPRDQIVCSFQNNVLLAFFFNLIFILLYMCSWYLPSSLAPAVFDVLNLVLWIVALGTNVIFALTLICASHLAIRTKLNCSKVPGIVAAHNNKTVYNQSKKLSRTLFVVIAAFLVF